MIYKTLQLDKDRRGVARLWLNRPDKHHAMNAQMINELHQAALALSKDETVRVIVIGSDGPIFCAGADLTWMQEQQQKDKQKRGRKRRRPGQNGTQRFPGSRQPPCTAPTLRIPSVLRFNLYSIMLSFVIFTFGSIFFTEAVFDGSSKKRV